MESNWRFDVAGLGWSHSVLRKAAQLLATPLLWVVQFGPPINVGSRVQFITHPDGVLGIVALGPALHGSFPYGFAVQPD